MGRVVITRNPKTWVTALIPYFKTTPLEFVVFHRAEVLGDVEYSDVGNKWLITGIRLSLNFLAVTVNGKIIRKEGLVVDYQSPILLSELEDYIEATELLEKEEKIIESKRSQLNGLYTVNGEDVSITERVLKIAFTEDRLAEVKSILVHRAENRKRTHLRKALAVDDRSKRKQIAEFHRLVLEENEWADMERLYKIDIEDIYEGIPIFSVNYEGDKRIIFSYGYAFLESGSKLTLIYNLLGNHKTNEILRLVDKLECEPVRYLVSKWFSWRSR